MLAVEGAANVPLDLGFEAGLETPFGLRVFGGYGWVVAPYVSWLRGASVSEGSARVVIDEADASGHVLRLKLGIRPFRRLGLYLDAGYGRADLDGALNLTGSVAELGSLSGGYGVHSALDLLLVELGYQVKVENRLILALGLGFTGTLNSSTTITPAGATIGSSSLDVAEAAVDRVFERYGFVPTLNLRVGFNVL